MAERTGIEWCDHTFNPWIGCTKVSAACDHCYAEALMDHRHHRVEWGGPRSRTSAANWGQPIRWNKAALRDGVRRKVFCASLADVFDNQVPEQWRWDLWDLIGECRNLDWLLLTKRPQNIDKMLPGPLLPFFSNVWLGTTVENQDEADRRIPHLLATPAAVRFLSCEPLLGPVDLTNLGGAGSAKSFGAHGFSAIWPEGKALRPMLDWVIAGGESGPGARPMHPGWARALRDQCAAAGVPFFFKQWGEWAPIDDYPSEIVEDFDVRGLSEDGVIRVGKSRAGRLLDGREHSEFPT